MRITNWGLGLSSLGFYFLMGLGQITSLIALAAGILIVMDTWRR